MDSTEVIPSLPADLKAALREALDNLAKGVRDPEAARKACEHMDRIREENRKLFGEQEIAVQLIRETRDGR